MTTDKSTDKLSKITTMFILWLVLMIISIFIVKKLDNTESSSFIFIIAEMSNSLVEGLIGSINNELIRNDIILSEQTMSNIIFAVKVYWMSSTLTGYCVLTYILGIGIFQLALKIIFCPLITPLVMPIVFLIAIITFIKNIVLLTKPVHVNSRKMTEHHRGDSIYDTAC